jgi:hypothetical protein
MPRASTCASIKAKTFLASSAGYQPGGKMSIVDRSRGLILLAPDAEAGRRVQRNWPERRPRKRGGIPLLL